MSSTDASLLKGPEAKATLVPMRALPIGLTNEPEPNGKSATPTVEVMPKQTSISPPQVIALNQSLVDGTGYEERKSILLEGQLLETRKQLADLQRRYERALVVVGERTEQVEELRSDMQDLKRTLRAQALMIAERRMVEVGVETHQQSLNP